MVNLNSIDCNVFPLNDHMKYQSQNISTGQLSRHLYSQCGDVPAPRFGHTTTYVGNSTVIMFGGACGDNGRYVVTNDTYLLNMNTFDWTKVVAENPPSARAAHAAACVDSMQFVIYGGATGGGSLSTDEDPPISWMSVPITGVTPGRRYGHTMVYHKFTEGGQKANLIVFGGNDGTRALSDIWYMDVQKSPFTWNQVILPTGIKQPLPRVYHSASICKSGPASGMMVIFGGRTSNSRSLRDTWGLRQHRDGRWDWVDAPIKKGSSPDTRFQHSCVFIGRKMIVIGGRNVDVAKQLPSLVYDTETCEWRHLPSVERFRHSSWEINNIIYTFGGFDHKSQTHPTADLILLHVVAYENYYSGKESEELKNKGGFLPWQNSSNDLLSKNVKSLSIIKPANDNVASNVANKDSHLSGLNLNSSSLRSHTADLNTHTSQLSTVHSKKPAEVKLSAHVHTKIDSPYHPDFSALVYKISIDRLEDESRRIRGYVLSPVAQLHDSSDDTLADRVIRRLLCPNITPFRMDRDFDPNSLFCLSWDDVSQLCINTLNVVKNESMVLSLRTPIKIYGDIHGQFYDLMRLFGSYRCPVEEDWKEDNKISNETEIIGDLDTIDYLFLGDYVDRGTHNLEVICLLFALKCRYPNQVHLIRGNHEDKSINAAYGFQDECRRRLREDCSHYDSCWEKFNRVFNYLAIGAIIEDRILCIHGGIGKTIHSINDILELKRPLTVSQTPSNEMEQRVTDLLWSDPTDNDSITGIIPNTTRDQDGSGRIYKFGPDRVAQFLVQNKLDLIIRAHECVMDGFERFAGGKLITLFSATDYCGHGNAGALLFIRRDLTVIPKIIYPPDREHLNLQNTWLPTGSRPPTPPRSIKREKDQDLGF